MQLIKKAKVFLSEVILKDKTESKMLKNCYFENFVHLYLYFDVYKA